MKLQSDFAILDVRRGRKKLSKHLDNNGGHVPVTIVGWVTGVWGSDDGTSQEFSVVVHYVDVAEERS